MRDYARNRNAYKTARERVRNVMRQRHVDKAAVIAIAKGVLSEEFPDAYVDLDDLCGACLFWQDQQTLVQK